MEAAPIISLFSTFTYLSYVDQVSLSLTCRYLHQTFTGLNYRPWTLLLDLFRRYHLDLNPLLYLQRLVLNGHRIILSGPLLANLLSDSYDPEQALLVVVHLSTSPNSALDSSVNPFITYLDSERTDPINVLGDYRSRLIMEYDPEVLPLFHHRTIPYPTTNVQRFLFQRDFELGPVILDNDQFYLQNTDDYLYRPRTIWIDREVYHWVKYHLNDRYLSQQRYYRTRAQQLRHEEQTENYLQNQEEIEQTEDLEHLDYAQEDLTNEEKADIWFELTMTGYDDLLGLIYNHRKQGTVIETVPPTGDSVRQFSDIWLEIFPRYNLIVPQHQNDLEHPDSLGLTHLRYLRLAQRAVRSIDLSLLDQEYPFRVNSIHEYPKINRIYSTVGLWILRNYHLDLPYLKESSDGRSSRERVHYRYSGPFDIGIIRRWFSQ